MAHQRKVHGFLHHEGDYFAKQQLKKMKKALIGSLLFMHLARPKITLVAYEKLCTECFLPVQSESHVCEKYICTVCGNIMRTEYSLENHMLSMHKIEDFIILKA